MCEGITTTLVCRTQRHVDFMFYLLMLTPLLSGEHAELQRQESADGHSFQQGDKVKCLLEVDILRQMQEGHGGWNPKMAEVLKTSQSAHINILSVDSFT